MDKDQRIKELETALAKEQREHEITIEGIHKVDDNHRAAEAKLKAVREICEDRERFVMGGPGAILSVMLTVLGHDE